MGMFYGNVLKVWNKIEMKTMESFNDLYLKYDDLSLPDVFEKFRNNSLRNYGLWPKSLFQRTSLKLGCNA